MKQLIFSAAVALMALTASAMDRPLVQHQLTNVDATRGLSRQVLPQQMSDVQAQFETLKAKQTRLSNGTQPRRVAAATGNTDLVEVPAGLQTSDYVVSAMSYAAYADIFYTAHVGIDGNDMYIQGLFEQMPEAWVKGTIEGNQVTFAPDQYLGKVNIIDQFDGSNLGDFDCWLEYTVDFDSYCAATLTWDVENGTLSDEMNGLLFLALDDDFNAAEALAYLRMTDADIYEEVSTEMVTPPASLAAIGVQIDYVSFAMQEQMSATGMMGIDGSDLYVLGLCPDFPGAWVKGTMDAEGNVTFASNQYIGKYQGAIDLWMTGVDPATAALIDVQATYDAATQTLIVSDETWIAENADPKTLYYFDVFYDVTVSPLTGDKQIVIPPVGLETTGFAATCISLGNYEYAEGSYPVRIGFDGDDAYMQGLFYYLPSAWIKGTRNADGSLTFVKNQYIGTVQGFDIYVVPCADDESILDDFTFLYENGIYFYPSENQNISFSIAPDCTDAVEIIYGVELAPKASAEDYPVISEQPEGEVVNYLRSGDAYYTFFGYILSESQNGMTMQITYAPDGKTVYMRNPTAFGQNIDYSWVKGTKEGNKIHMPLGQCTYFDEEEGYGYLTGLFHLGQIEYYGEMMDTYLPDEASEVTYTIHEDGSISLDLESEIADNGFATRVFGLLYTDDQSWAGFADYNTCYTLFTDEIQTLPEGLQTAPWAYLYNDGSFTSAQLIEACIDGADIYLKGLSAENPESVIKGQISGDKVTFASDQYMGSNESHALYAAFAEYSSEEVFDEEWGETYTRYNYSYLPTCTFAYDADKQIIRAADNVAMLINGGAAANGVNVLESGFAPRFTSAQDIATKPANPEILAFGAYYEGYGYDAITCNVPMEDIYGRYIDTEKLYYTIWVKADGEAKPFTFTADEYYQFPELGIEEMTEVPYNLVSLDEASWEDIALGGSYICLYQSDFEDYGVQSVYYGGGQRNTSDIVWLLGGVTGINERKADARPAQYFDLMGRQHTASQKGFNLIRKDGKVMKVIR